MFSIVIPIFNGWNMLHTLLYDIYNTTSGVDIIVADDCSTEKEVAGGIKWWQDKMFKDRLSHYKTPTNYGFLRNANFGVSKVKTENVLLLNSDVRLRDINLVNKIERELNKDRNIPTLVGARLLDKDTGWNKFDNKIFPYLEGWFLAFRKSDWDFLGGFDDRYEISDFEDVDLATKYVNIGGKLQVVDVNVEHIGGQTIGFSPEREAQTRINQKKFEEKWLK
jgi:GT2 family glycosyltransferase